MENTIIPKLVFSVFIFMIILYSSVQNILDIQVLEDGFSRFGVYKIFTEEEAQERAIDILEFFGSGAGFQYFDESERSHLLDVKVLLEKFSALVFAVILILLLWILLDRQSLGYLKFAAIFSLIALVLVIVPFLLDFNLIFQRFHEFFFSGNYSFDPKISEMKALFPDAFFLYISILILAKVALKSICILLVSKFLIDTKRIPA
jgi:integral membrane protein (TIGR01906 family)